jgi:hypothetical protein
MSVLRSKQVLRKAGYIGSPDWEPSDDGEHCQLAVADPSGCDWDVLPEAPFPVCLKHLVAAYRFVRESMDKPGRRCSSGNRPGLSRYHGTSTSSVATGLSRSDGQPTSDRG